MLKTHIYAVIASIVFIATPVCAYPPNWILGTWTAYSVLNTYHTWKLYKDRHATTHEFLKETDQQYEMALKNLAISVVCHLEKFVDHITIKTRQLQTIVQKNYFKPGMFTWEHKKLCAKKDNPTKRPPVIKL